MNQAPAQQSIQAAVDASQTYCGDYILTITGEGTTILQELDELTLNMSIE